ncbi:MAG: hypothetical protein JWP97_3333 [Labilithrix sp.]|nr:hypothetical protein [Labilithrix sp.]
MRATLRNALTTGALVTTALVWSGCEASKQTEYVTGVSTQVTVPRDMKSIVVSVSVGGVNQFCRAYRVYDGKVQLPRSLGQFPSSGSAGPDPLTIAVLGLSEVADDTSGNAFVTDCSFTPQKVGTNSARILRRSRQPYVNEQVLFLPMPLKFSCFDKVCPSDEQTCKGGRCVDARTDETLLPRYSPELVDGSGGACFHAAECFAAAVPPVVVNADDCTYALPNTPSAPPVLGGLPANPIVSAGDGINVEITYDGGFTKEVLDQDADEGFIIPDPAKPQRFRLAPGLCDLVKGFDGATGEDTVHRITKIRATGLCQAKGKYQPLCAEDANAAMGTPGGIASDANPPTCIGAALKPSRSVLMLVADDTDNNNIFYTGGGGGGMGSGAATQSDLVTKALEDPSFRNTFLGLTFFPGDAGNACAPHPPAVAPELASTARGKIVAKFLERKTGALLKPAGTTLNLTGALDDAYATLTAGFPDANRRAVFVIGNRDFGASTCGGLPADHAAAAAAGPAKINTYVGILARDKYVPDMGNAWPQDDAALLLAQKGDPAAGPSARSYDSRNDQLVANDALRKIIDELATCAYDVDAAPAADAVLSYSDPTALGPAPAFYNIAHDAACTSNGGGGNGWGSAPVQGTTKHRIYVCGDACTAYRDKLRTAAAYAAQYEQSSPAIPLFLYTPQCAPH